MTSVAKGYQLPEELKMTQTMVRDYVRNEIIPLEEELEYDAITIPREDFARLSAKTKAMGLWCMSVPEKYGGAELDIFSHVVIEEEMGCDREADEPQELGLNPADLAGQNPLHHIARVEDLGGVAGHETGDAA